jgi:hypothetical protein
MYKVTISNLTVTLRLLSATILAHELNFTRMFRVNIFPSLFFYLVPYEIS